MVNSQFYVVWNPMHGLPRVRHREEHEAQAEAIAAWNTREAAAAPSAKGVANG